MKYFHLDHDHDHLKTMTMIMTTMTTWPLLWRPWWPGRAFPLGRWEVYISELSRAARSICLIWTWEREVYLLLGSFLFGFECMTIPIVIVTKFLKFYYLGWAEWVFISHLTLCLCFPLSCQFPVKLWLQVLWPCQVLAGARTPQSWCHTKQTFLKLCFYLYCICSLIYNFICPMLGHHSSDTQNRPLAKLRPFCPVPYKYGF